MYCTVNAYERRNMTQKRNKPVTCLTLSESVLAKATEIVKGNKDEYPSKTRFFEIAGGKLWKEEKLKELK